MKKADQIYEWVECINASQLRSSTRSLLRYFALRMMQHNGTCRPTILEISHNMGLNKETVVNAIKDAEKEGWIIVTKHTGREQGWRNHSYRRSKPRGFLPVIWVKNKDKGLRKSRTRKSKKDANVYGLTPPPNVVGKPVTSIYILEQPKAPKATSAKAPSRRTNFHCSDSSQESNFVSAGDF